MRALQELVESGVVLGISGSARPYWDARFAWLWFTKTDSPSG